jgi:hypothetical protein
MEDRGEKIVELARAILCSGDLDLTPRPHQFKTISVRTVCLAAFLSAFCGGSVMAYWNENHRPLDRYERVELEALVAYAAQQNRTSPDSIRYETQNAFVFSSFDDLTAADYEKVRDYLRDRIR